MASTDGRWQNGTLRPQSRRSHLKSLVFINKVIIAFFPIALILYIDGPEIVNLKVKIILLSSQNLNCQKTPVEISGKTGTRQSAG